MNVVDILNQEQYDALPDNFEFYTVIQIKSEAKLWLRVEKVPKNSRVEARESAHVVAWGSAHVVARESAHVEAWGSAHVVARESAHVDAWGSAHVVARESAHVEAWGSAHVEAWESAHVEAWESAHVDAWESAHVVAWESAHVVARGSAHVEAWESAHVEARGSAHVVAWESAHVEAWGSAHVEAWGNSSIKALSRWCELSIKQFAVAICVGAEPKLIEQDDTATCIKSPVAVNDKTSFLGIHKDNVQEDGRIMLVKMVQEDNTDFHTGKIKYEGIVKCPDWDPDPNRQCGGGLHLSATETEARSYNNGKVVRCLVHPENIIVYGPDISKVRCSEVCAEVFCKDCGTPFFPNQTWAETEGIWVCPKCIQGK